MHHRPSDTRYENTLLAIFCLAFGFVFFDRLALSYLFPFIEAELQLSSRHLGMLSSALALSWALSGALAGLWSDRSGRRRALLIAAVVLLSLASALSGVVAGFVSLLVFRALMGLVEGPILPIAQSMMMRASSPHRRGLNMGLLQGTSAGLLGAVIAPPVLVALAQSHGWRLTFMLTLLPGLLIAWLIWRHVRADEPVPVPCAALPVSGTRWQRWAALRQRNTVLCALISCVFVAWFITLIAFTPTYLVTVRGFDPVTMGFLMSCLGVAWVVWGAVVPAVSDVLGRRPTLVMFSLLAACCPLALLFAPGAYSLGLLLLLCFTGPGCFTLFMATIPAETVPATMMATALGLIMGLGELVGGGVVPVLAGFAAEAFGLQVVMWLCTGAALIAAALASALVETAPARQNGRWHRAAASGREQAP